ncbi:phytanoyl-CoA dioxygenase family protein [Chloroflexi bacterium TSY]|nr:phytanoyl-CoA dioxygenase family protein [Chloroflexi bacterium TSY]
MKIRKPKPIADGTPFYFGEHQFRFGHEIIELVDSSEIRNDVPALQARMAEDGYLFIRGFHNRQKAIEAEQWTLQAIAARGGLKADAPVNDGIIGEENKSYAFFRQIEVSHGKPILDVVDSDETFAFYEKLFGGPVITFDKRWLRCMAHGGHNHFHYDNVYVGRGTPNRYTMWSALSDIGLDNGPLVICLGSQRHEKLKTTYGATDMDRDLTEAIFSQDPVELVEKFGFQLATAHFQPGDVILFGMFMMHSSAPNRTNRYRISIDTRYQPAEEEKDERFYGENGQWLGNFHTKGATYKAMEELRKEWGLD